VLVIAPYHRLVAPTKKKVHTDTGMHRSGPYLDTSRQRPGVACFRGTGGNRNEPSAILSISRYTGKSESAYGRLRVSSSCSTTP